MNLETLLVSLYALVDDWWKANYPFASRGPGRPMMLSDPEVLTLAILAQWPRWRSQSQKPEEENSEDSSWRYSFMNWGHDPLK